MLQEIGLMHFWEQGDAVTHATAIVLVVLSIASWQVILGKAAAHLRYRWSHQRVLAAFWRAESLPLAVEALRRDDRTGIFSGIAFAAALAAQSHRLHTAKGIGAGIDANEFITRALRQAIVHAQARVERGLTFLASVGSTAPFIGLFGTVWGIYHALVGLAGATQVVLDKVAGPVGEALVMTAGGLFVAIPAVLAYNASVRANRLVLAQLDGFAHDLHAYLTAGIKRQDESGDLVELHPATPARGA
jgi:biopolymer transport protein ExbB